MMREVELLQGSFWVVPWGGVEDLDMNFLSEFFEVSLEEIFDERRELLRKFIVLRKRKKFLGLTN